MSLSFNTSNPKALLGLFIEAINRESGEKGSITTWEVASDGFFTHTSKEWAKKLWFKAKITPNNSQLVFLTLPPKGKSISVTAYGYYHGHLIETFLNHFEKEFTSVEASALASNGDSVSSKITSS